jgi:hypothetical protein
VIETRISVLGSFLWALLKFAKCPYGCLITTLYGRFLWCFLVSPQLLHLHLRFSSLVFRGVLDLDLNWCKHGDSQNVFIILWRNTTESRQILVLVPM